MKFRITFKSPDGVSDSINDAALTEFLKDKDNSFIENFEKLNYKQKKEELIDTTEELYGFTSKWISGSEYITIEFDTDLGTAKVLEK